MFDGTSLPVVWFCSAGNAVHPAFTGLFSIRRLYYLPVVLALSTGLRRGEIFGLRWKDVDLVSGRMVVTQSLEETIRQIVEAWQRRPKVS